jgi:Spy/CpxP family protein refolding chaperone
MKRVDFKNLNSREYKSMREVSDHKRAKFKRMCTVSLIAFFVMVLNAGMVMGQDDRTKGVEPPKGGHTNQMGHMRQNGMMQNLTDDQKTKMKELKISLYKTVQPLHNQMEELKAKQHTLTTSEKPDLKAINSNIDEITKVQNQLMKAMAAHHQEIRSLLTEEQRIQFDSKSIKKRGPGNMHHRMADVEMQGSGFPAHLAQ